MAENQHNADYSFRDTSAFPDISAGSAVDLDNQKFVFKFFSEKKTYIPLCLCLWNSVCGGTLYMFPGMETTIMDMCSYTAADIDLMYAFGQFGVGLGFMPGFIFNQYSVFYSSIYALILLIIGTVGFLFFLAPVLPGTNPHAHDGIIDADAPPLLSAAADITSSKTAAGASKILTTAPLMTGKSAVGGGRRILDVESYVEGPAQCGYPLLMALFYYCIQHASVTLYQNGLFTGLATSNRIGATAGILAAGYGLSAAVWNQYFVYFAAKDVAFFVKTTGIIWAVTALIGMFLLQVKERDIEVRHASGIRPNVVGQSNAKTKYQKVTKEESRASHYRELDEPDDVPQRTNTSNSREMNSSVVELVDQPSHTATNSKEGESFHGNWREVIRHKSYWSVFTQFVLTQCIGSGLFVANLKLITGSFGYDVAKRDMIVTFVSFANAAGRLSCGVAMDCLSTCIPNKSRFMLGSALVMGLSAVSLKYEVQSMAVFLLVGLAYGANWAVLPAFMTGTFGRKNMVFGFVTPVFFMSGSVKLISQLTGSQYDTHKADDQAFCKPVSTCFGVAANVAVVLCTISITIGLSIWVHERRGDAGRKRKNPVVSNTNTTGSYKNSHANGSVHSNYNNSISSAL